MGKELNDSIWKIMYLNEDSKAMTEAIPMDAEGSVMDIAIAKSENNGNHLVTVSAYGHPRLMIKSGHVVADYSLITHMEIDGEDEREMAHIFDSMRLVATDVVSKS